MSGEKVIATQVAATVIPAAAPTVGLGALAPVLTVAGVAVGAVVVAAGAVVLTRAAMSGLAWLGDHLEESHAEWAAQQGRLDEWAETYAKVVACNARLSRVRARAGNGGGGLPDPISPTGLPRAEIDKLLHDAEKKIRDTETVLLHRATDDAVRRIPALARTPVTGLLAERLRDRMADRSRVGAAPPAPTRPGGGTDFTPMVEAILGGLDPEVPAADCAEVLTIAGRVTGADDAATAKAQMDALYLAVGRMNRSAETRRLDGDRAARYLQALRADVNSHGMVRPAQLAHHAELRRALEDVVAGRRELDRTLIGRAEDAQAEVRELTEQLLIRETWRAALAELDYEVEFDSTAGRGFAGMTVRHQSWTDAAARMVVAKGETRAVLTARSDAEHLRGKWSDDVMSINRKAFADHGVVLGAITTREPRKTEEPYRLPKPKERKRGQ